MQVADEISCILEDRLGKRLLPIRFNLLKYLLDSASSKDSGPQARAKSVKALGEIVGVDARLLSMQQVAMCLRTAMHVIFSNFSPSFLFQKAAIMHRVEDLSGR